MLDEKAAIAANRFGLGARPGDARDIGGEPVAWLEAQLETAAAGAPGSAGPPASARTLERLAQLRLARQLAQRARADLRRGREDSSDRAPSVDAEAIREYGQFIAAEYRAQIARRYASAIGSDVPFVERLVHFWSNHFAVSTDKQPLGALTIHYENEAIRAHVTGRFVDLLEAVERHPAMLLYLDNQASIGPQSMAARAVRRNRGRELGLNENLAREILELHTLGVNGGYDQGDVTEFAKVLTGWSIGGQGAGAGGARGRLLGGGRPGEFHFRTLAHEPGDKVVLGKRYRESGVDEGREVLEDLASHGSTAHHLATKLARHFVADEPPATLVDRLAETYQRNDGELVPVYLDLIKADESWVEPLAKFKTPHDYVISTFRALGQVPDNPQQVLGLLTQLGQRPLTPGSPAGWPDTAEHWNGGDALLKRIEWADAIGRGVGDRIDATALIDDVLGGVASDHTRTALARAESGGQAVGLLFAAPEFQRR